MAHRSTPKDTVRYEGRKADSNNGENIITEDRNTLQRAQIGRMTQRKRSKQRKIGLTKRDNSISSPFEGHKQ